MSKTSESLDMEHEIEITEALLKYARVLRKSPEPEKAIAAAKWEMRIQEELDRLQKLEPSKR